MKSDNKSLNWSGDSAGLATVKSFVAARLAWSLGVTEVDLRTIEAIYGVPGEEPVVQLFVPDGGQWGEVRHRAGRLQIELFAPAGQSSWVVDADELVRAIGLARQQLGSDGP